MQIPWAPVVVLAAGAAMIAVERAARDGPLARIAGGRRWPEVRGWLSRAALLNVAQALVVWLAGVAWDPWLAANRPWSADGLGAVGGAAAGYVAITFVYYWWHRARHEVPFLWRWLHQLHHSPRRIEIVTSFYKHPFELVANGVLSSVILYACVGLRPDVAIYALTATGLAELFYHWNVRTPYWVGFVVQRPESHCVHHEDGLHHFNYADLPVWDMMFGTFRNPCSWEARCGFGDREHELAAMLRGRDVSGMTP